MLEFLFGIAVGALAMFYFPKIRDAVSKWIG